MFRFNPRASVPIVSLFAVLGLAACGAGSVGVSTPTVPVAPPLPPPGPLTLSISSVALTQAGQTQTFTVADPNFGGSFTVASANPAIATVTPGASVGTYVVTAIAAGTETITVSDTAPTPNKANLTITVTTTGGTVH